MKEKITKRKPLSRDSQFFDSIALWLSDNTPAKQKKELETLFTLDYGGLVNAANKYMRSTIKAIKHGYMSLEGFGPYDEACFAHLFNCEKLDKELRSELSHLLYGADERAKYFEESDPEKA